MKASHNTIQIFNRSFAFLLHILFLTSPFFQFLAMLVFWILAGCPAGFTQHHPNLQQKFRLLASYFVSHVSVFSVPSDVGVLDPGRVSCGRIMYVLIRKVTPQNEGIARYNFLVLTRSVGRSLRVCRSISSLRWTATRHPSFVINNSASRGSWWWCGLRGCWLIGEKTNTGMYEALSGSQTLCSSKMLGRAVSTAQVLSSNIVPQ